MNAMLLNDLETEVDVNGIRNPVSVRKGVRKLIK